MKFNRDQMGNAPAKEVAKATMEIISSIQTRNSGQQVAAVCAAFLLLVEAAEVNLGDALTITKNIINHAEGKRPEFEAVAEYIRNEL